MLGWWWWVSPKQIGAGGKEGVDRNGCEVLKETKKFQKQKNETGGG